MGLETLLLPQLNTSVERALPSPLPVTVAENVAKAVGVRSGEGVNHEQGGGGRGVVEDGPISVGSGW